MLWGNGAPSRQGVVNVPDHVWRATLKRYLLSTAIILAIAAPALASEKPAGSSASAGAAASASSSSKSSATGVGVGIGKGGNASAKGGNATGGTGGSASANGDVDVSQGGDKTDNLGIAIAPPSFSYAPGAAVGECVATESYAIGFPLIGGGLGQQTLVMLPACVGPLTTVLRDAFKDQFAMAAACQSKFAHKALSDMNVDCDTKPAPAE